MKDGWHFAVENAPTACDPIEVVYRLVLIQDGEIQKKDGYITGCDHGIWKRIRQALETEQLYLSIRTEIVEHVSETEW